MNTILELFAGVGGFRYAADTLGLHTVAAYDFDTDACAAYERLHGSGAIQQVDLNAIDPASLPDANGIVGGPPCQPFSKAGRQQGSEDDRDMWPAVVSIVAHKKPDWFCFENVPAFLWNVDYVRGLLYTFMELGYYVTWRVLNAADYGVPQTRQRVFILGRRTEGHFAWPQPTHYRVGIPGDPIAPRWVSWFEALQGWLPDAGPGKLPNWITSKYPQRGMLPSLPCDGYFAGQEARHDKQHRERWQPAFTVPASARNRARVMVDGCVFNADERALAILQGLPSDQGLRQPQIGNAVPPALALAALRAVVGGEA